MPVFLVRLANFCFQQIVLCLHLHRFHSGDDGTCRGVLAFFVHEGHQWWQDAWRLSESQLEWRETCGRVNCAHDVEAYFWQGVYPAPLVAFHRETDALYDRFVCSFAGAVRLGMVCA